MEIFGQQGFDASAKIKAIEVLDLESLEISIFHSFFLNFQIE